MHLHEKVVAESDYMPKGEKVYSGFHLATDYANI